MRKILIILIIISFLILVSTNAIAWSECPAGYKDELYHETCWRYTDANNDEIYEHSQLESVNLESTSTFEQKKQIQKNLNQKEEIQKNLNQKEQIQKNISVNKGNKSYVVMIAISFLLVLLGILVGKILVEEKIIRKSKEKLFWNVLLLIFFIPAAVTGILIFVSKDLTSLGGYKSSFIQLHNISSLFFMWISAYHIIENAKYYTRYLKKQS